MLEAVPRSWNGSQITCQISPTARAVTDLIVLREFPVDGSLVPRPTPFSMARRTVEAWERG